MILTPWMVIGLMRMYGAAQAAGADSEEAGRVVTRVLRLHEAETPTVAGIDRMVGEITELMLNDRLQPRSLPPKPVMEIRNHSSDDMDGLGELEGVTCPVAVVLRPDGSVDVYGYVHVVDQRPE
jgi:hypothetical protein